MDARRTEFPETGRGAELDPAIGLDLSRAGLYASTAVITPSSYQQFATAFDGIVDSGDTLAAPYIAFLAKSIEKFDPNASRGLLNKLAIKYPNNRYVSDAVISNLQDQEQLFQSAISVSVSDQNALINKQLARVLTAVRSAQGNRNPEMLKKEFPKARYCSLPYARPATAPMAAALNRSHRH